MLRNKFSARSLRSIAAAAALTVAPLVLGAAPAGALTIGQTVCYTPNGTPVFNPPSEDGFEYCYTRPAFGGGSGGSGGPVLCTITSTSYSCSPLQPLQG